MKERISGTGDMIEETDTLVKENPKPKNKAKEKNLWNKTFRKYETLGKTKCKNNRNREETKLKGLENIFNKIIGENISNLK